MPIETLSATPLGVSYFYRPEGEETHRALGLNNDWPALPDGPLKELLSGIYLKNGELDRDAFMKAAGRLGFKSMEMVTSGPAVIQQTFTYYNLFLVPDEPDYPVGPKGSVGLVIGGTSSNYMVRLEISHSIIR